MKTKLLSIFLLLQSSAAFATDWDKLIEWAPSLVKETIKLDDRGLVVANAVKMPNGKYRFVNFRDFSVRSKPVVTFESDVKDVDQLCSYAIHARKPFKAKLSMATNPAAGLETNIWGRSKLEDFENPVKVGPATLSLDKKDAVWSMYDGKSLKKAQGGPVWEYYEKVLNEELKASGGNNLEMDLSELNAFACDLALGHMTIQISRTIEYEAGIPNTENWLGLEQYAAVYRNFWKLQPALTDAKQSTVQNEKAEALALGLAAANKVNVDALLQAPARTQKFLASVKSSVGGLSVTQKTTARTDEIVSAWSMNTEFTKPTNTMKQMQMDLDPYEAVVRWED